MKHKVIIDTDPGIDDTMAIAYAVAHPQIDLIGLTAIFGNVSVAEATENALKLLDFLEHEADVAKGEPVPIAIEPRPHSYFVHGSNGLGEVELPATERKPVELSGPEYLIEQTRKFPGEINICAVGPLTNLARALELDPTIVDRVKSVVIMGGAIYRPGNVSPVAEANIWNDPHAADAVFAASWSVVLAPLDVTTPVVLTASFFEDLQVESPKVGKLLADIARFYTRFYRSHSGFNGCIPHDVMALTYLTAPGIYKQMSGSLAVATEGPAIGQTIFQPAGRRALDPMWATRPKHIALLEIDADYFTGDYFTTITGRHPDFLS